MCSSNNYRTCPDPYCRAVGQYCRPGLPVGTLGPKATAVPPRLTQPAVAAETAESALVVGVTPEARPLPVQPDLRGSARPDDQAAIWSYLSRRTVGMRATAKAGEVVLRLYRRDGETSAAAIRRQGLSFEGYDFLLAFRCTCATPVHYVVRTADDLPDAPGPHGNCDACGATAVVVVVE